MDVFRRMTDDGSHSKDPTACLTFLAGSVKSSDDPRQALGPRDVCLYFPYKIMLSFYERNPLERPIEAKLLLKRFQDVKSPNLCTYDNIYPEIDKSMKVLLT